MRRTLSLSMALAALAWLALSPLAAHAQFGPVQNSVIVSSTTPVSASGQVATAQTFLTYSVGTGFFGTQPVKIISRGHISSMVDSPGTYAVTVAVGAISLTVVNTATFAGGSRAPTQAPYDLECEVLPTASATLAKEMQCEFKFRSDEPGGVGLGSTITRFWARGTGTLTASTQQAITATITFSNTGVGTGLVAQHNQVLLGN